MSRKTALSRRQLLRTGLAAPLLGVPSGVAASRDSIYSKLGVRTYINAYGTLTTLGGTLMLPEVRRAMDEAAQHFVPIHELQAKVGKRLAELTGAEAAFVTAGASASLCLATCAVTAGGDPEKIDRLPHLEGQEGMKSEIVIQKAHRNSYDHAFRMVGVTLVDVETAAEASAAIGPKTAALAMVLSHNSLGHKIPLEEMIAIAHEADLPLILDAAAELPPVENLRKFVAMGADLVAFSGGKNLRGPQCSGMLLGRKDLIEAAYANSAPHNRFARIAKVGKEEIVGLLTAVEIYLKVRDHEAERKEHHAMLERVARRLEGLDTVFTEYATNDDYSHSPRLTVQWDENALGLSLDQVMKELEKGEPGIIATDMTKYRPAWKGVGIFPYNLRPGEEMIVADRLREILGRRA
jgi:D-glucosaminate-6-phosphate ammonia-lyase